jgi:hypothetical protein
MSRHYTQLVLRRGQLIRVRLCNWQDPSQNHITWSEAFVNLDPVLLSGTDVLSSQDTAIGAPQNLVPHAFNVTLAELLCDRVDLSRDDVPLGGNQSLFAGTVHFYDFHVVFFDDVDGTGEGGVYVALALVRALTRNVSGVGEAQALAREAHQKFRLGHFTWSECALYRLSGYVKFMTAQNMTLTVLSCQLEKCQNWGIGRYQHVVRRAVY